MKLNKSGFSIVETLLVLVLLGALGGVGLYVWEQRKSTEPAITPQEQSQQTPATTEATPSPEYQFSGKLRDVTMGQVIRGLDTNGQATGDAKAKFEDGTYSLIATISDAPDPQNDDFYEGWIVRKQPFKFISTGKLDKDGDTYVNNYSSDEDLTDFDMYVLTIEPNNENPAPAEHIVEGVMKKN